MNVQSRWDDPAFWAYDAWPSGEPYEWMQCEREANDDKTDFHVDLGCGKIKKGRIGIDRYLAPGVNVLMDLDTQCVAGLPPAPGLDALTLDRLAAHEERAGRTVRNFVQLPFPDSSIESVITHHTLEHIGEGFITLIDEVYRVLKPHGLFRVIVPLFPSTSAVQDPDHKRYFMERTMDAFCGDPGDQPEQFFSASFSVPYTKARFKSVEKGMSPVTPPEEQWGDEDHREIRQSLRAVK